MQKQKKKILWHEAINMNLKMCRVFLACGKVMYILMIYNWKFNILEWQILQLAVYLYLNTVHFIIDIFIEMDVLRRSAKKSRMERTKNEGIKEIMGVKGQPDIIDKKWYGHVKRMPAERIPKLIMEWIPLERRKRGHP